MSDEEDFEQRFADAEGDRKLQLWIALTEARRTRAEVERVTRERDEAYARGMHACADDVVAAVRERDEARAEAARLQRELRNIFCNSTDPYARDLADSALKPLAVLRTATEAAPADRTDACTCHGIYGDRHGSACPQGAVAPATPSPEPRPPARVHHYSMSECPTWDPDARGTGGCMCPPTETREPRDE